MTRPEIVKMLRGFVSEFRIDSHDAAVVLGLVDDVLTSARNFGREETIDAETLGDYFEFAGHPELAEVVYEGMST